MLSFLPRFALKSHPTSDGDVQSNQEETGSGKSRKERKLQSEIRKLKDELDRRENEIRQLQQEKSEGRKQAEDLEKKLEHTRHTYQKQAQELQVEAEQHDKTRELLKTRTLELSGAQAFLTKSDKLSGAEVIGMIESLNQEVLQAAAFMADSFAYEKIEEEEKPSEEMAEATRAANRFVGRKLVSLLKTTDHREDPTLVQIALQTCIHSCCRRLIASRHFDGSRYGDLLSEMCRGMTETGEWEPTVVLQAVPEYALEPSEDQAIFGKWRALTSIHLQRVLALWKREPEADFLPEIVSNIIDVATISGVKKSRSEFNEMMRTFRDRLKNIKRKTTRLNRALLEEITSADMEALYVYPKDDFDPAIMDDANAVTASDNHAITGQVLCMTDLGLRRYVKISSNGEKPEWEKTILLKAKVVLPDAIKEMRESRARERRFDSVLFLKICDEINTLPRSTAHPMDVNALQDNVVPHEPEAEMVAEEEEAGEHRYDAISALRMCEELDTQPRSDEDPVDE
jgi:hypothetical protein